MQKTLVGVSLAVAAGVLSGGAVYVAVAAQFLSFYALSTRCLCTSSHSPAHAPPIGTHWFWRSLFDHPFLTLVRHAKAFDE